MMKHTEKHAEEHGSLWFQALLGWGGKHTKIVGRTVGMSKKK
uniref:Uncharacterized protein n=1 Tax=Oncorhynchus tshawytscha TaxID=74940 RepID=A0AAZ3P3F7_ONCTS